ADACSFNVTANFTNASGQTHNFTVYFNDSVGNLNSSGVYFVTFDSVAPSVAASSPADGTQSSNQPTFTAVYTDYGTSGQCSLYLDGALSSTDTEVANADTVSFSPTVNNTVHTWFVNCQDANSNSANSSTRTYTKQGGGSSVTATPTPTPATPASSSSGSSSGGLVPSSGSSTPTTATPAQPSSRQTGPSSFVNGNFGSSSASFALTYTAPASGLKGQLSDRLPFDFADYEAGLISITPEPSSVQPGSILATWDVALAPGETFEATVEVAKAVDESVLKDFKAPVAKPVSVPSQPAVTPAPTAAPAQEPVPAQADNTLWYVLGALIILGVLYYVFAGKKPKKGL
ncbi:MAG: hypothetical protein Q8P02_05360, partial [Candidatus Micrarchaeota archaeon]|nr:hypothetical protein [Candidatus Micrarchaeota archaeon]